MMVDSYCSADDDECAPEDQENIRNRCGKFLDVEINGNTYNETQANGAIQSYEKSSYNKTVEIEELNFSLRIDAVKGIPTVFLRGSTATAFGVVGAEGYHRIYDVTITESNSDNYFSISKVYSKGGHDIHGEIIIGINRDYIVMLRDEFRQLNVPRSIRVDLPPDIFVESKHTEAINGSAANELYGVRPNDNIILDHWRNNNIENIQHDNVEYVKITWKSIVLSVEMDISNRWGGLLINQKLL